MTDDLEELSEALRDDPLIEEVRLASTAGLAFDLDPQLAQTIVVVFFLRSFVTSIGSKSAAQSWRLVKRLLAHLKDKLARDAKPTSQLPAHVSYVSKIESTEIELVISYDSLSKLRRDLQNHPRYIALGIGYVHAKLPSKHDTISLRSLMPPESRDRVEDFQVRRARSRR